MTPRSAGLFALAAAATLTGCPKKNKPPPVERLWLGERVACAALLTGELRCQGDNTHGQLGAALPPAAHGPASMPVSGRLLAVVHQPTSLCLVTDGHPDACFGAGLSQPREPNAPGGCVLTDGRVRCSGPRWPDPPQLDGLAGVVEVAEGRAHACARLEGGTVACWGANDRGQLAAPPPRGSRAPTPVQGVFGATALVAAGDGTCAVERDHSVRCWGDNASERLAVGRGPVLDVPTPVHF